MSSFSLAFQNAGLCSLCENLKVIASSLTGLRSFLRYPAQEALGYNASSLWGCSPFHAPAKLSSHTDSLGPVFENLRAVPSSQLPVASVRGGKQLPVHGAPHGQPGRARRVASSQSSEQGIQIRWPGEASKTTS